MSSSSKREAGDAELDDGVVTAPDNKSDNNVAPSTSSARRAYPQRERKSTTIQIDGHTVLKTNNYRVKGTKYEYNAIGENDSVSGKEGEDDLDSSFPGNDKDNNARRKRRQRRKKSDRGDGVAGSRHSTASASLSSSSVSGDDDNANGEPISLPMKRRRRRRRKPQRHGVVEERHTGSTGVVGSSSGGVGNDNKCTAQQKLQLSMYPIGTPVEKKFPIHGWCRGIIEDIDNVEKVYTVTYVNNEDDGDGDTSRSYKEYYPFGSLELHKIIVHDGEGGCGGATKTATTSEATITVDSGETEQKQEGQVVPATKKGVGKDNDDDESFVQDDDDLGSSSEDDSVEEDVWSEPSIEDEDDDDSLMDLDDDVSSKAEKRGRPRRATTARFETSQKTKAPKNARSQWERQRIEHNNSVKSRVEEKKAIRTRFLLENLQVMKPFMDGAIGQNLLSSQFIGSSSKIEMEPTHTDKDNEEMKRAFAPDVTTKGHSGGEEDKSVALASKAAETEPAVSSTPPLSPSIADKAKQPIAADEGKGEAGEKPPVKSGLASTPYKSRKIHIQPELIEGGEMRDYQMLGLQFLVNMYHQNLGMILGDEMGLVSIVVLWV